MHCVATAYTIRLYFTEPDKLPAGRRVFNVSLQDRVVLTDFDIAKEAGGPGRTLVKEFKNVAVPNELHIHLTPSERSAVDSAVICGLEVIAE